MTHSFSKSLFAKVIKKFKKYIFLSSFDFLKLQRSWITSKFKMTVRTCSKIKQNSVRIFWNFFQKQSMKINDVTPLAT